MQHRHHFSPSRWSREHWVLASLFASLAILVATIIPGFAAAMRGQDESANLTTVALALPPSAMPAAGPARKAAPKSKKATATRKKK